jgi:hypothetical protein
MSKSDAIVAECMASLRGMVNLPEANKFTILMVENLFALAYAEGNANGFREAVEVSEEESEPEEWK